MTATPGTREERVGGGIRLGIRRRIMLYVVAGLALILGALIFNGLRAVDRATQLVFEARLSTANSVALTLERDLIHVAAEVREFGGDLAGAAPRTDLGRRVAAMMRHLSASDSFAFFDVDGVQVLASDGRVLEVAGVPFAAALPSTAGFGSEDAMLGAGAVPSEASGFGVVATRVGSGTDQVWMLAHLSGRNSAAPFAPERYGLTRPGESGGGSGSDSYHLEVFDSTGAVVLGIGEEETAGEPSPHFAAVSELSPMIEPVILRHIVSAGVGEGNHVMGVVPLTDFGLTLVLEQPTDVALALPLRLRDELLMWSGIGFVGALIVAWMTTRAVVRPTQQLTLAAERIAGGDLDSPIEVTARDEFGILADRFEAMRQQISSAYEAVAVANQVLESRVKERTVRLGTLLHRVISAQEEERARLARELHDETAQTLGALSIALGRAADGFPAESGISFDQVRRAKEMVALLLEDTRRLILDLRPTLLDDMGLIPAIRWHTESKLAQIGVEPRFEVDSLPDRLPSHLEIALFRIVQEATNNVVKHAEAANVDIGVSQRNDAVRIIVSDDGKGFEMDSGGEASAFDDHVGLAGMRERVNLLGGEMTVMSTPGSGTTVTVEIPLTEVGA